MRKKEKSPSPLLPLLVGAVLVILLKLVVFDSRSPFQDTIYDALNPERVSPPVDAVDINKNEENLASLLRRNRDESGTEYDLFEDIREDFLRIDVPPPGGQESAVADIVTNQEDVQEEAHIKDVDMKPKAAVAEAVQAEKIDLPPKQAYAPLVSGTPKVRVALIIDDVGVSRRYSSEVIKMDAGITLAFLPYASGLEEMVKDAQLQGHELMLHAPMEAMNSQQDLGPHGLRVDMPKDAFIETLNGMLDSFDGFVGVNNHMGSRLTQDKERMSWVMDILRRRDLFFVDSKTIHSSIADDVAQRYGVPFATRHVFLDHDEGLESVRKQLAVLEGSAYKRGYAIAIGHPKKNTLQAIAEWLPGLEEKGIALVPVSALIRYPEGEEPEITAGVRSAAEKSLALDLLDFDSNEDAPDGFETKSSRESKSFLERLGLP